MVLNDNEKERLAIGLREFLHGDQKSGFELMCRLLKEYKLAKWPLLTICPLYYRPDVEVFIKPTTTKVIIEYLELEGLKYSSKPTFEFYKAYREKINLMKEELDVSLRADNLSFCGFLMTVIENTKDTA